LFFLFMDRYGNTICASSRILAPHHIDANEF
jgi:hypothetical protein